MIRRTQRIKRKSSSKNKEVKQLMDRAEDLMKQVCFARDGKRCMVEKNRPDIEIIHGEVIQADHCISRGVKALYYNPRNLTACCNMCNWLKSIDSQGVRRAIDEIVIKREGQDWFDEAKKIAQSHVPFPHWKKVYWLQETVAALEMELSKYGAREDSAA